MSSIITPNMRLLVPTVGSEPGPDYATDVNTSLTLVDQHDHSLGNGVQVTPAGLNISSDLSFSSNNATDLRSSRYTSQPSALSLPADLGVVYVSGADLYYNDTAGNQVRLTQGGSIVGTAGSITGLPSGTASASYAAGTFTWQSATGTAANMDLASAILRNNTLNSKGLTLSPPNAMPADYSLVLPSLPGTTSAVLLGSTGNMSTVVYPLATASIADGAITKAKLATSALPGFQLTVFTSNGNFTVPANVNAIYVDAWGGGGGGGGGAGGGNTKGGGGGSSGVRYQGMLSVTPGDVLAVTVGAAGAGGAATGDGSAGGASVVGNLLSVPGGPAGQGSTSGSNGGSLSIPGSASAQGGGGTSGSGGSGANGQSTIAALGGTGATVGSGGGGGGGWLSGGNGGNVSTFGGGDAPLANSGAGGGGAGIFVGQGGNGQTGQVTIYWPGLP